MDNNYCLSEQEQKMAKELAMNIYQTKELCPMAFNSLWENKKVARVIIKYWKTCKEDFVVYALNRLLSHMSRRHLEDCYKKDSYIKD